jgi:hypothetical protein
MSISQMPCAPSGSNRKRRRRRRRLFIYLTQLNKKKNSVIEK